MLGVQNGEMLTQALRAAPQRTLNSLSQLVRPAVFLLDPLRALFAVKVEKLIPLRTVASFLRQAFLAMLKLLEFNLRQKRFDDPDKDACQCDPSAAFAKAFECLEIHRTSRFLA